ncbi:NAD-dependent epimerase/dehydratase family protein [Arenimonas alkanexedens]
MTPGPVVVAGAGDVGLRLARLRIACGDEVVAVRRGAGEALPRLRWQRADLVTGDGLAALPRQAKALVFCAAPDVRDEAAYRALYLDGLHRAIDACAPARVVFVSSTAVYAEDAGEWVDEFTPARPPGFNGQVLLKTERSLAAHPNATALRCSGIYGPGRGTLRRKARGDSPGRWHWTNRIHAADAAAAISHLLDLAGAPPCLLANDDQPALEAQVWAWLRQRDGLPALAAPVAAPATGRRVSNARLRATGWAPAFPDYRAGYADVQDGAGL